MRDIEHEFLWLPSALPGHIRVEGCLAGVETIEEKLHEAQCLDAWQTWVVLFVDWLEQKVQGAAEKYRAARTALVRLQGPGTWQDTLQELHNEDLKNLEGADFTID
ncbi:hypothetical protein EV421DRAFT_1700209 [Armillaria borealis]|uniref:Uncharacterized protein n=1 Tax=Armillaria borealis TaxID=47425 RepID=A0AA39K612_9AGAR|nr:hypothetical protein EV421DRAFT_1700209 [Armillaria borealis]